MTKKDQDIIFSEPIREIMEKPPRYLARFGTMGLFGLMALFVFLSWVIKYPDTIPGKIVLTTENPPANIIAKSTGRIMEVSVAEGSLTMRGDILAGIESSADFHEAELLVSFLDSTGPSPDVKSLHVPIFSNLGDMQESYSRLKKAMDDYRFFEENNQDGKKAESVLEEISNINSYIRELEGKKVLIVESLALAERQYRRDSLLHRQGVMPDAQFEISRQSVISVRVDLQQTILEVASRKIELAEKRSSYNNHLLNKALDNERYSNEVKSAYLNLLAAVDTWKAKHLLIAPVDGVVTLTRFWSDNQFVTEGDAVMAVVPLEPGKIIGKAELSMKRAGKVKPGQDVIIKLSGYPFMEFGSLKGKVSTTSLVPEGDKYIVEVALQNGMISIYGKELTFSQNMEGMAEIVTEDYRLINKIADPLRYMWNRNRRAIEN